MPHIFPHLQPFNRLRAPSMPCHSACSTCLPHLQDLQLASTSLLPLHGKQLLRAMLVGAAGSLRRLNLRDGALGDALESLAGATQLTWLDLSGAPIPRAEHEPAFSPTQAAMPAVDQCFHPPFPSRRLPKALLLQSCCFAGTPVTDGQLEHLALAPLRWASFARTAVTDDIATGGMKHMNTLTCLDLRFVCADVLGDAEQPDVLRGT